MSGMTINRRMLRRTTCVLAAMASLLGSPAVSAQPVDEASKSAARQIGKEGLEAYKAGRYEEALDKLSRAFAVVRVPALGLWTARAMVQTGKLVEASELYHQVGLIQATGGDQEVQEAAKQEAATELEALMPRIPKLTIELDGAPADQVAVTVDGVALAPALIRVARPANPGQHTAVAKLGEQQATESVTLAEGESKTVVLRIAAPAEPKPAEPAAPVATASTPAPAEPATGPAPPPAAPPPAAAPEDTGAEGDNTQRTLGFVGLGVGAAGIVFGTITGALALQKQSDLEAKGCVDGHCYNDQADDVDSLNSMRTLSTVGFVVGAIGAAAGATLLLTAPDEGDPGPEVQAWIGVGQAGVAGRF